MGIIEHAALPILADPALEQDLVHGERAAVNQEVHLGPTGHPGHAVTLSMPCLVRLRCAMLHSMSVAVPTLTVGHPSTAVSGMTHPCLRHAAMVAVVTLTVSHLSAVGAVSVMARHHLSQFHPTLHRGLAQRFDTA